MNVIIANRYKNELATLDIEVIKRMDGTFSADELVDMFQNFFFNKMILDLTALEDYNDLKNIQKLSISLDMNKIIFLLPPEPGFTSASNLSKLIAMGIYNFTASVDGIMYLYNNPNSYRDVVQYHQLGDNNIGGDFVVTNDYNNSMGMGMSMSQRIIGVKNLTSHSGATTLVYMMYKHLSGSYATVAIEADKRDFNFYNDRNMKSVSGNEINRALADNADKEVILIDVNGNQMAKNSCHQVIYLIEPSVLKVNKLISTRPRLAAEMRGKYIVLNKCLIPEKDIKVFEYETKLKISNILVPVDDHVKSEEMYNFLRRLGFDRV